MLVTFGTHRSLRLHPWLLSINQTSLSQRLRSILIHYFCQRGALSQLPHLYLWISPPACLIHSQLGSSSILWDCRLTHLLWDSYSVDLWGLLCLFSACSARIRLFRYEQPPSVECTQRRAYCSPACKIASLINERQRKGTTIYKASQCQKVAKIIPLVENDFLIINFYFLTNENPRHGVLLKNLKNYSLIIKNL